MRGFKSRQVRARACVGVSDVRWLGDGKKITRKGGSEGEGAGARFSDMIVAVHAYVRGCLWMPADVGCP